MLSPEHCPGAELAQGSLVLTPTLQHQRDVIVPTLDMSLLVSLLDTPTSHAIVHFVVPCARPMHPMPTITDCSYVMKPPQPPLRRDSWLRSSFVAPAARPGCRTRRIP